MNRTRRRWMWCSVAAASALGGCASRRASVEPAYFESSAGPPAAVGSRPNYATSAARYSASVEAVLGSGARLDATAPALEDLGTAVASMPGAANAASAEAIRAHARELRLHADDPLAARRQVGLALAAAADAFDTAARILYPHDVALSRAVADLWHDVYPVVTDESQADGTDVYRALTTMTHVLRTYQTSAAKGPKR